eukprot:3166028-Prymnesium_polylepis.1
MLHDGAGSPAAHRASLEEPSVERLSLRDLRSAGGSRPGTASRPSTASRPGTGSAGSRPHTSCGVG